MDTEPDMKAINEFDELGGRVRRHQRQNTVDTWRSSPPTSARRPGMATCWRLGAACHERQ